jgi:hypothetical protein
MSVLSEYENNPELHIQKLKIKERQLTTMIRLFSKKDKYAENEEKMFTTLNKIKDKLQEYKCEYPEYFI